MTFPVAINLIGAFINAGFYLYGGQTINLVWSYVGLVFALYFYLAFPMAVV